jgi:hypothetical protein
MNQAVPAMITARAMAHSFVGLIATGLLLGNDEWWRSGANMNDG